ncbi:MAG: 50S ribosomal protein L3 N(5)-glutamine methyltransferase [Pseudomonadota bacterium]
MNNTFAIARSELHTIRDWLRFAVSCFNKSDLAFGHGNQNAFDEAAYLILHTLHLPLDQLEPFLEARLLQEEIDTLANMIEARINQRVPMAYLTHEAWLGEYRFYVDERVIVPRSFIAELLRDHLEPWIIDPDSVSSVLDMCTGSGCLAILAALTFPNAQVDGVDISDDALEVARRNVGDYDLEDRVSLVQSDLFKNLKGRKYDLIITNPPYVNAESMSALPVEYRHEPQLALASGDDGLDHIRVILSETPKHLTNSGILVVEAGNNRDVLEAAFPDLPFQWLEVSAGDEYVFLLHRDDLK